MAVTLQQPPKVEMLPLALVRESPSNPRKTFTGIDELAEDVKLRGILQPVLVRAAGSKEYELVFGARRYRAAKAAGMEAIPAFVRALSDEETLEIQLVENSKRADIHPLEEAEGYHLLHEKYGHSVDEIAAKVGKSRSAVYQRLALRKLCPEGREAFFAGKLSASVAMVVAGLAPSLQAKAVKDVAGDNPMSYRHALDHLQRTYMLQLSDAPFDMTDAALVAKAGACSTCPKRTGNQRELFGDVKSPDVCTDPICYREKKDALWKLQVAKAKESGQKVMPEAEAKKLLKFGRIDYGAPYVDLAAQDYSHGGKTYKELLPKKDAPTPVLARDADGNVHELLPRVTFNKATGRKERNHSEPDPQKFKERQARAEKERKDAEKLERAVTEKLVAAVEKGATTAAFWRLLVRIVGAEPYMIGETLRRRGIAHAKLAKHVEKLHDRQLRGLVFEFILEQSRDNMGGADPDAGPADVVADACKTLGVDYEKVKAATLGLPPPNAAPVQAKGVCAIPGCGESGKKTKGAPGLWCNDHGSKLSAVEKKAIAERNKRLAADGKATPGKKKK